jgi:hypothetical protein
MASPNSSQASQPPDSSYPSQSTALRGQRVWVSPEFGDNEEMYRWIVSCHGAELIDEPEDRETFHLLPKFSGVRLRPCLVTGMLGSLVSTWAMYQITNWPGLGCFWCD